ncbi:NAD-dependent protein deacetylase [Roseomonas sp. CCTCC AB2023176]|uniref:NAD-dependent protein deacetylase n=1 Tax=Roseomonas sp. CCTCC AB2023176 TaxID=3342640 RepID=UPI0035DC257E
MITTTALEEFIGRHRAIFVLTGAGCSTGSGIPDYRDEAGAWKRSQPMTFQAFTGSEAARQRYWARSMIGWPRMAATRPNGAHAALARLESAGRCAVLLTQNVDGLHQRAGSRRVVDLHGRLDLVRCLGCGRTLPREAMQEAMIVLNPGWGDLQAAEAPDGDAELETADFARFSVPPCPACGAVLKPDVVFFGENVPKDRVTAAYDALGRADAVLVVGSSLMVWSGFRFVQAAVAAGKPIAAVNRGRTRADDLLTLKVVADCAESLSFLL